MNASCYVINVITTDPWFDLSSLKYEIQQRRL